MVFNYVVYDAILGNKFLQQIVPSCKLKIYTVLKQELKEPKRVSGLQDTKRGRPLRRLSPQRAARSRAARCGERRRSGLRGKELRGNAPRGNELRGNGTQPYVLVAPSGER